MQGGVYGGSGEVGREEGESAGRGNSDGGVVAERRIGGGHLFGYFLSFLFSGQKGKLSVLD